ncbi:hypothetical protein QWY85_10315 [Neolewinella lacunae]|uniref:Uncharacterized protein n=1 Tax=Neolewinella lacunae TaxID=1517758 RepID=A0A923PN44_9BACT|nr:hypothetical protein [Neolewinella lacunae]MBC6995465.1 hypothetical protein [Neolewinella lacunae]MDN3635053.1 hypothetical protein [Neolewinella lacunae]
MTPTRYTCLLGLLLLCLTASLRAQDLESIAQAKPIVVTGGLRFGTQFYNVTGIEERAAPLQLSASGRINIAILEEFNIPISFAIGRQRPNLNFPIYRQFGLSPRYKWLTVHAGYRNMRLSNFTLNNHTFLGGGVELNPGKLRVAGMYGRLRQGLREVTEDIDLFFGQPLYNRYAWGGRVGWGDATSHFDVIYFRAEDRDQNVLFPDSLARPAPAENLVLGIDWRQRIGQNFTIYGEAAASGYNRNQNSEAFPLEEYRGSQILDYLFTPKFSTQSGLAIKGGASYATRAFNLGLDYERIDPGFESMGTYFLNGDWENIRGSLGFGLFQQRLRLQGSLGVQRNNLYEQRAETSRRTIGSLFATLAGRERWSLGVNYSNFNQDHRPSALVIFNDTLRIASTTENYGANWTLSGKGGPNRALGTFVATINLQRTNNDNPLSEGFDDLRTLFSSLNYSLRLANQTSTLTTAINYSEVDVADRLTTGYGGTLGWRQQLANKKIQVAITNTYNRNSVDGTPDGFSNALRGNLTWQASKLHAFDFGFSWLERTSSAGFSFTEQRGTLSYGLSFPVKRKDKAADAANQ